MDVRSEGAGRSFRFVKSAMTLLIVGAATCGMASAEEKRTGGPTPSAPGAEVYFSDLKDGATIPPKATIRFGLREMGVAPAGSDRANSGHHHLLIVGVIAILIVMFAPRGFVGLWHNLMDRLFSPGSRP